MFKNTGILNTGLDVISSEVGVEAEDNPFLDGDKRREVQSLIEETMPVGEKMWYLQGNDDLPMCLDLDNHSWEAYFLYQLEEDEQEVAEEQAKLDMEPPPKIQNFKEAVKSFEDVQQLLESLSYKEERQAVDTMTLLKKKSS